MSVSSSTIYPGFGCCDFQLPAQDKSILTARSMEFPVYMDSKLITFNRCEKFVSKTPDGSNGLSWVSTFGFVGINFFNENRVDEGMNEAGLSFGCLSLDCSEYQNIPVPSRALSHLDLGLWILSNFATVEDVKKHINDVLVWGEKLAALNEVPGLHFAIHDAKGNNLVIEYINGKAELHDNPIGVLTNDPPFKYQLENLSNYNSITSQVPPDATINGTVVKSKGMGRGLIGLPGDYSPVSRFVRVAKDVQFATSPALNPKNSDDAFKAATHILNRVDKLKGSEIVYINGQECYETTLWATIKRLSERIFCFRSYGDMTWRAVDLKQMNFRTGTPHKVVPIQASKPSVIDITQDVN